MNISKVSGKAQFKIHSASGRLVSSGTVIRNQVNVSKLVPGTYLITISDKDFNGTVKFIKK